MPTNPINKQEITYMLYSLKKSFQFKNYIKANAFLEIVNIFGTGRIFGSVVLFEGVLEFIVWRKLQNLAKIILECNVNNIDIHTMASQAGFKAFREVNL
jgi:hypothetical protein